MKIVYDDNAKETTMNIFGNPNEMVEVGRQLATINENITFELGITYDPLYKNNALVAFFKINNDPNQMINVEIVGDRVEFTGGSEYYNRLGESFVNFYSDISYDKAYFIMDRHDECIIDQNCMITIFCSVKSMGSS